MADATRADSVPFDAMKVMLAFQRLERQTHGAGLCRRGAARHGAGSRPVTSMISRRSGWRAHTQERVGSSTASGDVDRTPPRARVSAASQRISALWRDSCVLVGAGRAVGCRKRAGGVGGAQEGPLDEI